MQNRTEIKSGDHFREVKAFSYTANINIIGSHAQELADLITNLGITPFRVAPLGRFRERPTVIPVPIGLPFSFEEKGTLELDICYTIKQEAECERRCGHSSTDYERNTFFNTSASFPHTEIRKAGTSPTQNIALLIIASDNATESNELSNTDARPNEASFNASVFVKRDTGAYARPFNDKPNYAVRVSDMADGLAIAQALLDKIHTILHQEIKCMAERFKDDYIEEQRQKVEWEARRARSDIARKLDCEPHHHPHHHHHRHFQPCPKPHQEKEYRTEAVVCCTIS